MTGTAFIPPRYIPVNNAGVPRAGAKLYFFESGTDVPADVFTTASLGVALPWPVVASASGEFPAIYLDPNAGYDYRAVLKTSADVQVWSEDGIPAASGAYAITASEIAAGVVPVDLSYPPGDVRRYGAQGNGADDSDSFTVALSCNDTVTVPDPSTYYVLSSGVTVPANKTIRGANRRTTQIRPGGAIDLFTLGDGACLENLYLEGGGLSARGLVFSGTAGNQTINDCRVINFDDSPIEFTTTTAGSRCTISNVETWHTSGTTGSGNYAIVMAAGSQLTAVPRKFTHLETSGKCAIDFGGCNDVFVSDSFIADLAFTSNSRGVLIHGCRIANQASLNISGPGVTITGCAIAPALTVSGSGPVVLSGNYYNSTVTDSSTTGQALIMTPSASYTPTWTGASSNPDIGNGTLRGEYSRNGDVITLGVEMTAGSSTTFGSGQWRFALPMTPNATSGLAQVGSAFILDSGTTFYLGACVVPNGGTYLYVYPQMRADTNGEVASLTTVQSDYPHTWASGDILRVQVSYFV